MKYRIVEMMDGTFRIQVKSWETLWRWSYSYYTYRNTHEEALYRIKQDIKDITEIKKRKNIKNIHPDIYEQQK